MNKMIEKVKLMEHRYNELSNKLSEPGVADNQKLFTELMKEFKITWQNKHKFLPLKRVSTFLTSSEQAAIALCYQEFGNEKKIEILSVEEVVDQNDS